MLNTSWIKFPVLLAALYVCWRLGWAEALGDWLVISLSNALEAAINLLPRHQRARIRRKIGIGSPSLRAIGLDPYDY